MQLNIKHIAILPPLLALLTACSWDELLYEDPTSPPLYEKTPIELSVGGMDSPQEPTTRAVITDGTGKMLNAFDVTTKIFMVMKSEYDETDHGKDNFGGEHTTKYNVARGDVDVSKNDNTNNWSLVDFDSKNQRYWDDAHARSSMLSIYAYAQKGQNWTSIKFNGEDFLTDDNNTQPFAWRTTEIVPTILSWSASNLSNKTQTENTVMAQDLLFSNNLVDNGTGKDGRMKFNFTTRKFPREGEANMIFYHAMSKITIKIIEGEGFDKTSANKANDFKFTTTGGNIILKQFNHTGTFDIKQGEFTSIASGGTTDIPSIYLKTTNTNATGTDPHYILEALTVPSIANNGMSRIVDERKSLTEDVMMEFAIDNNLYHITHDDLYEALRGKTNATMMSDNGNYIPLEAGKNYVFTFTVEKSKIKNITAQVVDWESVNAEEQYPSNARITLNVENRTTNTSSVTSNMDIYRALDEASTVTDTYEGYNWTTKYTTDGKATWNSNPLAYNSDRWSTDWFWESNKTYYHFRTLSPTTQVVTANAGGDYTTITSSSCSNEGSYNAMSWGAPFLNVEDSYKFTYSTTKGFDGTGSGHQIYKAIGPTKNQIKVLMFHMFSGVHFTVKTTGDTDKVELYDGANRTKVDLVGYYPDGKVLLGTGLVNADGTISTEVNPYNIPFASAAEATHYVNQEYFFSAIPQDLTNVVLVITTPDHNQYKVKLWDSEHPITATVTNNNIANPYEESSTAGKYKINRWYPGFKYNYSFTLAKTGITNLQATIVDWENVSADNETVKIQ